MVIKTPKSHRKAKASIQENAKPSLFYLAHDHWSPRFGATFFTTKIISRKRILSKNAKSMKESLTLQNEGRTNLPACYYAIEVLYGPSKHICHRRYSQFEWLFLQLSKSCNTKELPFSIPSKTYPCVCISRDELVEDRQNKLNKFLMDSLQIPGNASHPAVITFLDLEKPAAAS